MVSSRNSENLNCEQELNVIGKAVSTIFEYNPIFSFLLAHSKYKFERDVILD